MDINTYHNKDGDRAPTGRTTLKRLPERGSHDLAVVHAVLDAAFVAHVGIQTDHGPVVIPTAYGRVGDQLYLHGSPASRLVRSLKQGVPVCVTVTLVDGLVLARSTFHHSINYRSVVVFGVATEVVDLDEKAVALAAFVEHVVPGRTAAARAATEQELRGTTVLALPVVEASAKVRTGPPVDDVEDLTIPVWAGVVPLAISAGAPLADVHVPAGLPVPDHVTALAR